MTGIAGASSFTGSATLMPEDGAVLMRASLVRLGFWNQSQLIALCAGAALLSAGTALGGYRDVAWALFVVATALFVLSVVAGRRTRRSLSSSFGRGQNREITVDGDGVTVREPHKTVWEAWAAFDRAVEAPEHVLLFSGPGIIVIPKRAFAAGDVEPMRALVASKLDLRAMR